MGRYGEIWGDMGRYGEITSSTAGRYGEIWGDMGRYGEITSSTAGWNSAHHSDKKAAESRSDAEMASSLAYQ